MTPISAFSRVALRTVGMMHHRLTVAQSAVSRSGVVEISRATSTSTMHDNDPEVLEREKQRNLSGAMGKTAEMFDFAPGWNETLASASEAHIKADKSSGNPIDLQRRTVEFLRVNNDPENREATTAFYLKDEVTGPLQTAQGHDDGLNSNQNEYNVDGKRVSGRRTEKIEKEIEREIRDASHMTASEQDVKADRGEFK
uniref:Uncharacterized protein Cc.ctg1 n=1 Tax=Coprinopsis cinerea TaxID=5346 RepID=C0STT2_COPCI|nr:hypothetical protein [Coprinopsis cinerea]